MNFWKTRSNEQFVTLFAGPKIVRNSTRPVVLPFPSPSPLSSDGNIFKSHLEEEWGGYGKSAFHDV